MAIVGSIFFNVERKHRCRAALERDLAATTSDPARRKRHLARAAFHEANGRGGTDAYLLTG